MNSTIDDKPGGFERMPWWCVVVPFFLAIAVFAITLGGTFIYDDKLLILDDPRMENASQWQQIFTQGYNGGADNLYRPIVTLSFAIQSWIHRGDNAEPPAWPFHLFNVLLHAIVSALVSAMTFRSLTRSREAAGESTLRTRSLATLPMLTMLPMLSGVLFAVHPIHTEAVASIYGRAELLCAAGMLGTIVLMLSKTVRVPHVMMIALLLIIAVGSKEFALLFFAMAGLLTVAMRVNRTPLTFDARSGALLTLVICIITASLIVLREQVLRLKFGWDPFFLDPTSQPLKLSVGLDRWLLPFTILGRYVALVAWPVGLSLDHAPKIGHVLNPGDPYFYLGIVTFVIMLTLTLFALFRRRIILIFLLGSLCITYFLISNSLIMIGTIFGERLLYLPTAFLFPALVLLLPRTRVAYVMLLIVCAMFAMRTVEYAARWNDRASFYEYLGDAQPGNARLAILATTHFINSNELDRARQWATRATGADPSYFDAWLFAAEVEMRLGEFEKAHDMIEIAAKLEPGVRTSGYRQKLQDLRATTRKSN